MKRLILLSSLVFSTAVDALLPPLYQSLNEYKTLLASPEFARNFEAGEAIQDIQRTDKGFAVTSTRRTIEIDVVYEPMSQPGPAKFHFKFPSTKPN